MLNSIFSAGLVVLLVVLAHFVAAIAVTNSAWWQRRKYARELMFSLEQDAKNECAWWGMTDDQRKVFARERPRLAAQMRRDRPPSYFSGPDQRGRWSFDQNLFREMQLRFCR